jgi:hypothetical protein
VCQVAPYPIWRGASEWWIERKPVRLPPVTVLLDGADPGVWTSALGSLRRIKIQPLPGGPYARSVHEAVSPLPDKSIVLLANGQHTVTDTAAVLEAVKLFEFIDDLVAVSGRLVRGDMVVSAGFVSDEAGRLSAPYDLRPTTDPGPYALGWKPQCITAPVPDLCFVRAGWLKTAAARCPDHCAAHEFGLFLGAMALADAKLIGYSPLIVGQASDAWRGGFDPITTQTAWDASLRLFEAPAPRRRGAAGYGVLKITD